MYLSVAHMPQVGSSRSKKRNTQQHYWEVALEIRWQAEPQVSYWELAPRWGAADVQSTMQLLQTFQFLWHLEEQHLAHLH